MNKFHHPSHQTKPSSSPSEEEESGWTMYFDDFFLSEDNNRESLEGGSSLLSDADSSAPWKIPDPHAGRCKRLSFKKKRGRGVLDIDEALEDTASSPVNSPKMSYLKQLEMNTSKKFDNINTTSLEEGGVGKSSEVKMEERSGLGGNESRELKERGLFLVPLSMFANYLP